LRVLSPNGLWAAAPISSPVNPVEQLVGEPVLGKTTGELQGVWRAIASGAAPPARRAEAP